MTRFAPLTIGDAVDLFSEAPFRWWISGGNALDLHVGASWRDHGDLDIGVVRDQAVAVHRHLEGWDLDVAARGRLTPWDGHPLSGALHENNVWARRSGRERWEIDLTVGEGTDEHWVYRRDPSITLPWEAAVLRAEQGIPYLAPHVQLLFKSKHLRPKDGVDAERVIPGLSAAEVGFLRAHLPEDHPWVALLDDRR